MKYTDAMRSHNLWTSIASKLSKTPTNLFRPGTSFIETVVSRSRKRKSKCLPLTLIDPRIILLKAHRSLNSKFKLWILALPLQPNSDKSFLIFLSTARKPLMRSNHLHTTKKFCVYRSQLLLCHPVTAAINAARKSWITKTMNLLQTSFTKTPTFCESFQKKNWLEATTKPREHRKS